MSLFHLPFITKIALLIRNFKARVTTDLGISEADTCLENSLRNVTSKGLFDITSLMITPNALKASKLYSIIPSNGNGDMTVVRATTTATRVNSLGFIELTPYNLLGYSEDFSNIIWQKLNGSSISLNTNYINPSGGSSTYKYTASNLAFGGILRQASTITSSTTYTFSFFCKKDNYRYVGIRFNTSTNSERFPNYDFDTDTLNTQGVVGATLSRELFSNGWVKLVLTYTSTTTAGTTDIGITSANGSTVIALTGTESVYIWGAQLVQGSVPKDYFYTTDRLNVPRLNYDSVGGCPSILVEPQRTNLATYSEQISDVSWGKSNLTVTADAATSPDGTINADRLIENTTTSQHAVIKAITIVAGQTITYSVYLKMNGRNSGNVFVFESSYTNGFGTNFNLSTGVVTINYNQGTGVLSSSSITNVGNGWYRCTVTGVIGTFTSLQAVAYLANGTTTSYLGDGTSGLFMWGAQLEAGAYPTSYIPTTTATTRNADGISKTGIADLIGQTEGTFFIDFQNKANEITTGVVVRMLYSITDGTVNNRFSLAIVRTPTRNYTDITIRSNNVTVSNINVDTPTGRFKIAVSYKIGATKMFINGVLVGNVGLIEIPIINRLFLGCSTTSGGENANISINTFSISKTALTDTELISLTTL